MRTSYRRQQDESRQDYRVRLKKLLEIDLNALEHEWVGHPKLMMDFCADLEEVEYDLRVNKAQMEVIDAGLDKAIRLDPESYGISKVSEGAVKHAVLGHKRHVKALAVIHELMYEVGMLQGVVRSMEHRKKSLENLVSLWSQGYWSGLRTPEQKEARDRVRQAQADRAFSRNKRKAKQRSES